MSKHLVIEVYPPETGKHPGYVQVAIANGRRVRPIGPKVFAVPGEPPSKLLNHVSAALDIVAEKQAKEAGIIP